MSLIESNSTKSILPPNGVYQGKAVRPDLKYITIQITATFEGGNSGLLEVYYSIDGVFYDNFGDSWTYTSQTGGANIFKETQMKGSFFYVKWTNNSSTTYTSFNLNTKLAETTSSVSINGVVDISGGSSGGGGLVQIQGYNGEDWENVTATMGNLAVNDYQGNTKLDTLIDKNLNYDVDNVSVNKVVEPVLYNLQILGTQMYADSINSPIVDIYGRDGWFWTNLDTSGGSNAYWYSNTIVPQNQMTKAQMDCVFVILALDRVNPNIVLPFVPMYSLPTGSGDIAPGFAHSSWTYTIDTTTSRLNAGEVVMLVIGDSSKVANIRPELRRLQLILQGTNGDALPSEVIGLISLNTDSGTKLVNSVQYLLQNAGFYYSVTDKIVEYEFNNGVQNAINVNLTEGGININGTVTVSGNVNVDNFPTSFQVSSLPSVEINNFPTSTEISNFPTSTEISNFPTSTEISNFPTSFEVSNTVSVYDSNTEAINQKLTNAAAPNNDCIKVFQANNPTSIEVSNFPASQAVTGTFWQTTQPVSGTFWQATQPVSGSVSVSNLPATQPVSGSVSVSNFPASQAVTGTFFQATQPVSGSVSVSNLPATQVVSGTVGVSNLPAVQAVSGTFFQETQPVSGSVSVSNLPTTQAVSGTVGISNFPASQAVTGTFWQATQPVSGSVSVSNLPATQPVSGSVSISNFPATQAVSGSVTVNTISGFTLDTTTQSSNTKLDTIHTDLDGLTYDASSNLNVNIASGSLTVDSVKIKATNGDSITATTGSINSNITNTSLDTHCYASSNGTNWHHLKSDANGILNIHSMTQDGAGTDITSTLNGAKQSLDVNVANTVAVNTISGFALESGGNLASIKTNTDKIKSDTTNTDAIQVQVKNSSIAVTGTITANISANQRVLANVCDKQDNGITSTNHTINKYGLDTTSALATTDMTTRYLLTSTSDGGSKRGLDVNIASGTLAVTGAFFQETQPVSIASSVTVTGDITIDNDSTTNFNSATGLNVYQILPKVKMYSLGGFDGNSTANSLIIGAATAAQVTSSAAFNFGGTMQFWAVLGSGGSRSITFDYVDSSGNIQTTTVDNINSSTTISLGTFKSILDFRLSSGIVSGETLYIGTSGVVSTLKERSVYYEDINQKLIGAITIPTGYIGYITNLTSQVASASNITLNRWNSSGIRSAVWRVNNQGNVNINSGYEGALGGIFTAGDTLAFSAQSAVASKSIVSNLVLKSIL